MKAVIIGSGSIADYSQASRAFEGGSSPFVICCDGGAIHARKLKITPDVIVGDLDSIDKETLEYYESLGVLFDKYPSAKDFTDMEIGLKAAIDAGADEIVFLGATGDRLDHSLANVWLLYECVSRGINAAILDDNNKIKLIDKKACLSEMPGSTVSLLPFTQEVTGITTEGLLYPLKNESLRWGSARGVSNVVASEGATVDLKSGILMVISPIRT